MTLEKELQYLKNLPIGTEVEVKCGGFGQWFSDEYQKIIQRFNGKCIKVDDDDYGMMVRFGNREFQLGYGTLTCPAIKMVDLIAPDNITRFQQSLDEELLIAKNKTIYGI
jgi:hypothetical protein